MLGKHVSAQCLWCPGCGQKLSFSLRILSGPEHKVLCPKESGNFFLFGRRKALLNYFLIDKGESEQHICQLKK